MPQLSELALGVGPGDLLCAATTSRYVDDEPTVWCLQ